MISNISYKFLFGMYYESIIKQKESDLNDKGTEKLLKNIVRIKVIIIVMEIPKRRIV